MIKNILILVTMICFTSLSHAIELVNEEKSKMQDKGITDLVITDNKVGDGREAEKGLTVTVHYTGFMRMEKKLQSLIAQWIEESLLVLFLGLVK